MKKLTSFIHLAIPAAVMLLLMAFTPVTRTITGVVTDSQKTPLPGVSVKIKGTSLSTSTDKSGNYSIQVPDGKILVFSFLGFEAKEAKPGKSDILNIVLRESLNELDEVVVTALGVAKSRRNVTYSVQEIKAEEFNQAPANNLTITLRGVIPGIVVTQDQNTMPPNTESYNSVADNLFQRADKAPLSTFSIDVDAASYSNIRRFINAGQLPPADAVRIEEMVNYFSYNYPQPKSNDPLSINTEISSAPWNTTHRLVKIGLQGKSVPTENLPASNLVFLIDVSGSMNEPNKLPLVQSSLRMLVGNLREKDKVAIVVYAGAAGVVLPATSCDKKELIKDAIDKLQAGGSTAGGAGIKLAYKIAKENFVKDGNNRVILATDGDFNVGASSDSEMEKLIEEKRESGIFLTVLGYGMGNYKDSKMETLADKGNGNYAYIDNFTEAKKVLINEFGGTLFTIAKDVKLQIEFNPVRVKSYRLIGYENRMLNKEDFNNDKKDAGELGSGHIVTALYEIIPVGVKSSFTDSVDNLKYQTEKLVSTVSTSNELFTVKLRYKNPDGDESKLMEKPVIDQQIAWSKTSDDFRFAASVAAYGMLLRKSEFKQDATYSKIIEWTKASLGEDTEGYRSEFLKLVRSSSLISKDLLTSTEK